MGHLTNPISVRLGKTVWWKDEYLSLSKPIQENFFFYLQSFFERFLASFFGRKNRFEYEGVFYFGSKLFIGKKIYLYVFIYDQKIERFQRRRIEKKWKKKKKYLLKRKEPLIKNLFKGCQKLIRI